LHSDIDFMLLDLNLPGQDGLAILEAMVDTYPTIPVAIVSASTQKDDVDKVMERSAMGYIFKHSASTVILGAVRLMLAGGLYTPPLSLLCTTKTDISTNAALVKALTKRQTEVLSLLVAGFSNKQIASELDIAEATIKMHITAIFRALGVTNRTQAALAAEHVFT
jgi:DNA-binding NarL/FixJ family response regulator